MNRQSYADWSSNFHSKTMRARVPISATIEVTRRCPLACAHCYNNLPMGDQAAKAQELTLAEHQRLLDEMAELGCLFLLYTGGEIFARRDFLELYTYAKHKGFLITLFTNGTLITPAIADALAKLRPFAIEITLYGGTRETYETLTGQAGSFDRCIRGIDLLLQRGLPLKLKTVAVSLNVHELALMKQFAADRGVPFKFDAMMNPRIDCSQSPLSVRLSAAEIVHLDLEDSKRLDEWRGLGQRAIQYPSAQTATKRYSCGAGISAFAVDPAGKMSLCVLSQQDTYDLRQGSLRSGWESFLRRVREQPAQRTTKCTRCALKSLCGMCPANGELENHDAEAPVDFLCRVAHLRAYAFGFEVPEHGTCEYCPGGQGYTSVLDELAQCTDVQRPVRKHLSLVAQAPAGGCSACAGG